MFQRIREFLLFVYRNELCQHVIRQQGCDYRYKKSKKSAIHSGIDGYVNKKRGDYE